MIVDPRHVWRRTQIGWDLAFWLFLLLAAVVLAVPGDLTAERRVIGYIVVVVIALAYLVIRPSPERDLAGRNLLYLLIVIVGVGLACAVDTDLSLLLFIAYSQMWIFSGEVRSGVVLTGALTVSSLIGFLTADGWSWHSFAFLGPTMAVSVLFSLLIGIWISRIIDQSRERAELIEQLEATRSELGEVHHAQGVTQERERMAREIHDTLAQGFTSIIMLAQAARAEMEAHGELPSPAIARLDSIELVARENLGEARALVAAFSPIALEDSTLTDAVRRLAERFGTETGVAIDVEVSALSDGLAGLSRDREVVLLRSAQEALSNVRRHAQARLVTIRLSAEGAEALVEVQDDGVGFEPAASVGFGLTGMRDRVRDAGGELDVASAPGRGTRVRVRVPVAAAPGLPVTP